jgi:hypothetical protein
MPLPTSPSIAADLPSYKDAVREEIERRDQVTLAALKDTLDIPTPSPWDASEERYRVSRRLSRLNRALRGMVEDGEIERISWGTYARINRRGT